MDITFAKLCEYVCGSGDVVYKNRWSAECDRPTFVLASRHEDGVMLKISFRGASKDHHEDCFLRFIVVNKQWINILAMFEPVLRAKNIDRRQNKLPKSIFKHHVFGRDFAQRAMVVGLSMRWELVLRAEGRLASLFLSHRGFSCYEGIGLKQYLWAALAICYVNDYFEPVPKMATNAERFLGILSKLPLELQLLTCGVRSMTKADFAFLWALLDPAQSHINHE